MRPSGLMVSMLDSGSSGSEFESWPGTLCCVLQGSYTFPGQKFKDFSRTFQDPTLKFHGLFFVRIYLHAFHLGGRGGGGGGLELLLVISCHRKRDKLQPDMTGGSAGGSLANCAHGK